MAPFHALTLAVLAVAGQTYAQSSAAGGASGLTINTPASLTTCQVPRRPAAISWQGGRAPYFLAVIPGGQPSAAPLESFPQQSGNSLTWTVDVAAGTSISLQITDSTGVVNYSDPKTILAGTSTACVGTGTASSAAGGSAAAGATTSAAGAGATSSAGGAGASSRPASASSPASAAAASTSARSAGTSLVAPGALLLAGVAAALAA